MLADTEQTADHQQNWLECGNIKHGNHPPVDSITCRQQKLRMNNVDYQTKRLLLLRQQELLLVLLLVPYV
jgi:hypothetical protein